MGFAITLPLLDKKTHHMDMTKNQVRVPTDPQRNVWSCLGLTVPSNHPIISYPFACYRLNYSLHIISPFHHPPQKRNISPIRRLSQPKIVGSISHVIPFPNVLCTGDYVGHINICMYNMYTCICIYIYTMRVM